MRADEEGFKKIFGGLALAKQGDLVDSDELLEEGYDMMAEGLESVIALQATVNSNSVTLQNINQEIVSLTTYWQGIKDDHRTFIGIGKPICDKKENTRDV